MKMFLSFADNRLIISIKVLIGKIVKGDISNNDEFLICFYIWSPKLLLIYENNIMLLLKRFQCFEKNFAYFLCYIFINRCENFKFLFLQTPVTVMETNKQTNKFTYYLTTRNCDDIKINRINN